MLQLNKNFIFSCSPCSFAMFILTSYSLCTQVMLILILFNVQYLQMLLLALKKVQIGKITPPQIPTSL